eukprot:TRINITY_DN1221_c0_g3_i1.p1 TRINITY_DN1221_c0_g3~~TRINITY_DN1221_c0_g3_i1.p1  ORF type:complete len:511 (+),score=140.18 TRINITY_DN1221_c0_g3_i1:62-1594(+)
MADTTQGLMSVRGEAGAAVDSATYNGMMEGLRTVFDNGKTKSVEWRRSQLEQIKRLIEENHEAMTEAVRKDLGGPKLRGLAEFQAHEEAETAIKNLKTWTSPERVPSKTLFGKATIRREPKGVMLLIAPWNYPIQLMLTPLVSMIAAGNCAVIKPSEMAPACGELLEKLINKYMDTECIKVVQGAVPETTALLAQEWDHIFYTGNGAVAKIVMQAAAKNLTPVTLELGGKSPVFIDKTARVKTATARITMGKWINCGQTCIAPDYILVHTSMLDEVVEDLVAKAKKSYPDPATSQDWGNIINARHVDRVQRLIQSSTGKIVLGGSGISREDRFIPPTIIVNPSLGDAIMQEEIFGPVLPVLTYETTDGALRMMNKICKKPLALYVFSEDKKNVQYILDKTQSGGVCINSTLEQVSNNNLPFGGVGPSGLGGYHGAFGFREFTHFRSTLQQDTFFRRGPGIPLPPYKEGLYDLAVKATITGFLTKTQKTILKGFLATVGVASAVKMLYPKL